MKTHVTLQVALTEADISQNLTISIFLGTVETNSIQTMCETRDRSTPEVSVISEKKYFVRGYGHFSEVKCLTVHR
jgi:hypothetical protein